MAESSEAPRAAASSAAAATTAASAASTAPDDDDDVTFPSVDRAMEEEGRHFWLKC